MASINRVFRFRVRADFREFKKEKRYVFGNANLKLDRRSGSCTFVIGRNPKGLTTGHVC